MQSKTSNLMQGDPLRIFEAGYLEDHAQVSDIESLKLIHKWVSAVILERTGPTLTHVAQERPVVKEEVVDEAPDDSRKDLWKAARQSGLSDDELRLMFGD